MNEEVFAEWLRRQGHHVIQTKSSYWYDAGPRVFQAFPYGDIIMPADTELRGLLMRHAIVALRYSTPVCMPEGKISYHVVLNEPAEIDCLSRQTRTNIRRGLRSCHVEKIPLQRLAHEGWILQHDTLKRQGRLSSMSQKQWERICLSAIDLPGFAAWGAIIDGELAASILTARINDKYYVPYAQSLQKYMCKNVNHALFYSTGCSMISQKDIHEIFYSLHSLDAPESVNEFKFRMGFSTKPVRQRVVINPLLFPLANKVSYQVLKYMTQRYLKSNVFSKAEGMMRFHLMGKQPIEDQDWPKCLSEYKNSYFDSTLIKQEKPSQQPKVLIREGD